MARDFRNSIEQTLKDRLLPLEKCFEADVVFYCGEIHPAVERLFRDVIEQLQEDPEPKKRLALFLNTPGGMVETAEKIVKIIRHHYNELYVVVPDYAMSAGTILCMSADNCTRIWKIGITFFWRKQQLRSEQKN
jgi:ATP-dependent protease ClpP protease subunit